MQLPGEKRAFDARKAHEFLQNESKFITELLALINIPARLEEAEARADGDDAAKTEPVRKGATRAKSLTELQDRLHAITSKKRLSYKEKLTKKSLKSRMKKRTKRDIRNAAVKSAPAEAAPQNGLKTAKPVFNSEGKMVFSKFDFSNAEKPRKQEKDAKKILEGLTRQKEEIEELTERGELAKVVEIREKSAWRNALAKAQGVKVKDDEGLLKKTIHRKEQKKRASKRKWEKREENVAKAKKERQDKRTQNLDKRKSDKKKKKMKTAAKRGRIIPGLT